MWDQDCSPIEVERAPEEDPPTIFPDRSIKSVLAIDGRSLKALKTFDLIEIFFHLKSWKHLWYAQVKSTWGLGSNFHNWPEHPVYDKITNMHDKVEKILVARSEKPKEWRT